jgi:antitoxin VapB
MALNLKNPEVERLAAEVAMLAKESKTEAIRRALEERKQRLSLQRHRAGKGERLRALLEERVWPSIPARLRGKRLSKAEREKFLGYGEYGV